MTNLINFLDAAKRVVRPETRAHVNAIIAHYNILNRVETVSKRIRKTKQGVN